MAFSSILLWTYFFQYLDIYIVLSSEVWRGMKAGLGFSVCCCELLILSSHRVSLESLLQKKYIHEDYMLWEILRMECYKVRKGMVLKKGKETVNKNKITVGKQVVIRNKKQKVWGIRTYIFCLPVNAEMKLKYCSAWNSVEHRYLLNIYSMKYLSKY